jgi:hypothetical protein
MTLTTGSSRFNLAQLSLAAASLLIALTGPHGQWWGIDVGAIAAFVYGACVAVFVLRVVRNPGAVFPEYWSLSEKRAWSALSFGLLILLSFAHFLWSETRQPELPMTFQQFMFRRFGWNLGVLLLAGIFVDRALGAHEPDSVELDERDLRIRHHSDRAGNATLSALMVLGVVLLVTLPEAMLERWFAPLIAAHLLIGVLICKSLAENLCLVAIYARERR